MNDETPPGATTPEDLDRYVFCAPCGRQHAHMRDCPIARPWRCESDGAVHYTAAAVVAHLRTHTDVVEPLVFEGDGGSHITVEAIDGGPIFDISAWPEVERAIHFAPPRPYDERFA